MQSLRPTNSFKKCALASALVGAALCPHVASAALGEPATTVQSEAAQLHGSLSVGEHQNYRLHEIQLPSGTLVREFSGRDGRVFAVSWNGPSIPNLRQTLGRYFDHYVTAAKAAHAGHHRLQINRDDLVIKAGGHMRAFSGLAYLPQALPSGVNVRDLH